MTLIKSISGIRGTIGGRVSENLTPIDTVKFAAAYGSWLADRQPDSDEKLKVVIGRDARISGEMMSGLVSATLSGLGINVVDLGLSTTPTVEVMVTELKADGGIILTASHNPKEWNALKLLDSQGEFLSAQAGEEILELVENEDFDFAPVDDLGSVESYQGAIEEHIKKILALPVVDARGIREKKYKAVVDGVNSSGGIAVPMLLRRLGVEVVEIHCDPNGDFPHDPEPLEKNLGDIMQKTVSEKADLGIVVDPDVDRLAFICEDGSMFGEEYTLVAVADFVLSKTLSPTVSNLSSTRALRDITEKHGQTYFASAVGEVNVVNKMKEVGAKIGGEGNGGVIYPELHYGRDALVGIALFLTHLTEKNTKMTELKGTLPEYYMSKRKVETQPQTNTDVVLNIIRKEYEDHEINDVDGLRIDFDNNSWVHMRASNTERAIRIYAEAQSQAAANDLAQDFVTEVENAMLQS